VLAVVLAARGAALVEACPEAKLLAKSPLWILLSKEPRFLPACAEFVLPERAALGFVPGFALIALRKLGSLRQSPFFPANSFFAALVRAAIIA
jgi:hypothetical protein